MRRILPTSSSSDYEALKPYVDKVVQGQENILWKENRSILLRHLEQLREQIHSVEESMPYHIEAARNAICITFKTGKADFVDGKMIFLQGSPLLEEKTE
jgi:hypothetical protein